MAERDLHASRRVSYSGSRWGDSGFLALGAAGALTIPSRGMGARGPGGDGDEEEEDRHIVASLPSVEPDFAMGTSYGSEASRDEFLSLPELARGYAPPAPDECSPRLEGLAGDRHLSPVGAAGDPTPRSFTLGDPAAADSFPSRIRSRRAAARSLRLKRRPSATTTDLAQALFWVTFSALMLLALWAYVFFCAATSVWVAAPSVAFMPYRRIRIEGTLWLRNPNLAAVTVSNCTLAVRLLAPGASGTNETHQLPPATVAALPRSVELQSERSAPFAAELRGDSLPPAIVAAILDGRCSARIEATARVGLPLFGAQQPRDAASTTVTADLGGGRGGAPARHPS